MAAFLVVAILNSADGSSVGKVIDHVIAADLATAQAKVTAAAPRYAQQFSPGTAQVGLIPMAAAFTVAI